MSSKTIQAEFGQRLSTFQLILLSFVSFNFALYNFIMKYIERVSSDEKKGTLTIVAYISFGFFAWSYAIPGIAFGYLDFLNRDTYETIIMLTGLMSIIGGVGLICISIMSRNELQNKFNENKLSVSVNLIWCVIFPMIYQYYLIYNSEIIHNRNIKSAEIKSSTQQDSKTKEHNDKYAELEKLSKLKDSGIISEEEFNEQKKKILS